MFCSTAVSLSFKRAVSCISLEEMLSQYPLVWFVLFFCFLLFLAYKTKIQEQIFFRSVDIKYCDGKTL